jgi:hypothetical protein
MVKGNRNADNIILPFILSIKFLQILVKQFSSVYGIGKSGYDIRKM